MPVLDAFGGLDEKDAESLYRKGEIEYFQPFIKEKGYLLENYLVNYLFVFCHDFFDGERRWEGYLKFALIFGLMKFNMIGLGLAYQGLGQDLVLKLIQSLAKTFVPDRQYFYSALQYMKKQFGDMSSK
jgi:lysine-N-methylase